VDKQKRSAFYGGDVAALERGTHYASPVAALKGVSALSQSSQETQIEEASNAN